MVTRARYIPVAGIFKSLRQFCDFGDTNCLFVYAFGFEHMKVSENPIGMQFRGLYFRRHYKSETSFVGMLLLKQDNQLGTLWVIIGC